MELDQEYGLDLQIEKANQKNESQKADEDDKDIADMSEEEIQNMSTEELIGLFRGDLNEALINAFVNKSGTWVNLVEQNAILCDLVNKMTDEQLKDFMQTYKEMYPSTNKDGKLDFFSYEMLEKGVMWGNYAVQAGKISQDELDSAMLRLKEYCPNLNVDSAANVLGRDDIYTQWA